MKSPNRYRVKRGRRSLLRPLLLIAFFALAAVVAALLEPAPAPIVGAARASDGDTLRIGDERIRLLGLDAPELDQTCGSASGDDWPCGQVAKARLAALIKGAEVRCASEGRDRYGRMLAHCDADGDDVGALLVDEGLAIADFPNYATEEAAARRAKRGLWQGQFMSPRQWRDTHGDKTDGFDLLGLIRSFIGGRV